MEKFNINHKSMTVWSCGSKNALPDKISIIFGIIFILVVCGLCIHSIIHNLFLGLSLLLLFGWIPFGALLMIKGTLRHIKQNKLITLHLFQISAFIKLNTIPEDMFILFSDNNGAVLAEKKYEEESRYFSEGYTYFHEFEDYYDNHAVKKINII